jgi:hypothetical protein
MEPTTAVLLLSLCSADGKCIEMKTTDAFVTPIACEEALPFYLDQLKVPDARVSARCVSVDPGGVVAIEAAPIVTIDPTVTAAVIKVRKPPMATVTVTRFDPNGLETAAVYEVPAR